MAKQNEYLGSYTATPAGCRAKPPRLCTFGGLRTNGSKFKAGKMMGGAFLFPVPLKTAQVKR